MTTTSQIIEKACNQGLGIFRFAPNWVPRAFCVPGKRLRLHPADYYAFGAHRGGIDERWFASTTKAENGPETLPDEGLSYLYINDGGRVEKALFKDALDLMGKDILGADVMAQHGGWTMYSKFFDNLEPLPHHMHQDDRTAAAVGQKGKPEGYYFPPQLNNHGGYFPYTFFGLNPGVTQDDVKACLRKWEQGDNGILYLSRAYKLQLGTGWDVPPGLLHAPGSLLTYEPQRASDVFAMFQSLVWDRYTPWDFLVKNVPPEYKHDLDYIVGMLDWELNVDPDFYAHQFLPPKPLQPVAEMRAAGYTEYQILYNSSYFSAKELTILPQCTVTLTEPAAYGLIVIAGHGQFGPLHIEAPALIRFGELTNDELFVTADTARAGVTITNHSDRDNLVMLKHFGPAA